MSTRRDGVDRRDFLKGAGVGAAALSLGAGRLFAGEGEPGARVKRRPLGRTGIEASVIAYGCGGLVPAHLPLLRKAYDSGINLIDTAYGYTGGQSEAAVGMFCTQVRDRESFHIVTKATGFAPPRGSAKAVYDAFKRRVTEQLTRLKTGYIDVYYWPHGTTDPAVTRNEAARDALRKLKEEGLIRHVGTSSHKNYAAVAEAAIDDGFYEVAMPVINICTQNPDEAGDPRPGRRRRGRNIEDTRPLIRKAKAKGVGIVAMKVANPQFQGAGAEALLAAAYPNETALSRHQRLYKYLLGVDGVTAVVVGIRTVQHLKEAIAVGVA